MKYEERTYRSLINKNNLISYNVKIAESDLFISSDRDLTNLAFQALTNHRLSLESYIANYPAFRSSLLPLEKDDLAPLIIRRMIDQTRICGVGPMASVAGAIAEFVGYDLLEQSENVIIENGGDIFLKSNYSVTVSIYAGESTLSHMAKLHIKPEETPIGICTSSATVGPSLSFGKADAVCVLSKSSTLADAAASAIGNQVKSKADVQSALNFGMTIPGVKGIVIIIGDQMGAIGDIEFA